MLRKVCLRTGQQRHSSRARPSPHANTSRRPLRAVLLRKVSTDAEERSEDENWFDGLRQSFNSDHSQHRLLHFLDTLEVMIPNAMDGKRKRNGRFISTKSKRKRVSLTEYEKKKR